jgi:hypothetical protein
VTARRLRRTAAALAAALAAGGAAAQGARIEATQPQSQARSGPSVHVGAGTSAGATTGSSGPQPEGGASGGLPPLPAPELCDAYRGQEAHAFCLATVLGEGATR